MKKFIFICMSIALMACNETAEESKKKEVLERKVEQVTEYYSNGKKKMEGEKVNGERHGMWKYYYANGYLWSEGEFWYGERKGYSIIYYNSGKKQMEGSYKNGLKVGEWKLWNEDGSLNKVVDLNQMLTSQDSIKLELKPGKQ